jgi:ADP-ribose pyrophosphatase YjhB (NUDIX family)
VSPGVGCGAAIVRDRRLLLVKRLKAPEAGCWNLPGGKVEFGEAAVAAVKREVFEELGVEIETTWALGFVEMIVDGQHWVSPIYAAEIVAGEPVNREPSKHAAILWADLTALPSPLALAAKAAVERLAIPC